VELGVEKPLGITKEDIGTQNYGGITRKCKKAVQNIQTSGANDRMI
jgi:hypothetical protein